MYDQLLSIISLTIFAVFKLIVYSVVLTIYYKTFFLDKANEKSKYNYLIDFPKTLSAIIIIFFCMQIINELLNVLDFHLSLTSKLFNFSPIAYYIMDFFLKMWVIDLICFFQLSLAAFYILNRFNILSTLKKTFKAVFTKNIFIILLFAAMATFSYIAIDKYERHLHRYDYSESSKYIEIIENILNQEKEQSNTSSKYEFNLEDFRIPEQKIDNSPIYSFNFGINGLEKESLITKLHNIIIRPLFIALVFLFSAIMVSKPSKSDKETEEFNM